MTMPQFVYLTSHSARIGVALIGATVVLTGCAPFNPITQLKPMPERKFSYLIEADAKPETLYAEVTGALARDMAASTRFKVYPWEREPDWHKSGKVSADAKPDHILFKYSADWVATRTPVKHHVESRFEFPLLVQFTPRCVDLTLDWPDKFESDPSLIPNYASRPELQADAERIFRTVSPTLKRVKAIREEFDVAQGENAVFANFRRLPSMRDTNDGGKIRNVLIPTATGPWEVEVSVDATPKGSKVVYRSRYAYELRPDCTSTYSEANLADLKARVIAIANN